MSIQEINSHSMDFETVAKQATMYKAMNIHLNPTLKHCFVRFRPLVTDRENEKTAKQKVDRLEGILRYGLVAENFAKRIGIPISRNWSSRFNEKYVSLTNYNQPLVTAFFLGAMSLAQIQIPRENMYMMLIKKILAPTTLSETSAQNRIAPRFFMGIVIADGTRKEWPDIFGDCINFDSSTTKETVEAVVEKMQYVYKDKPDLCIPIYGLSGKLYWPKNMGYRATGEFVRERKNNGI